LERGRKRRREARYVLKGSEISSGLRNEGYKVQPLESRRGLEKGLTRDLRLNGTMCKFKDVPGNGYRSDCLVKILRGQAGELPTLNETKINFGKQIDLKSNGGE